MARRKDLVEKRNKRIKATYNKLREEKIFGKPKYSYMAILAIIEDKECIAADYIAKIINRE